MPRPARQPDPTPEEIAERSAAVRAERDAGFHGAGHHIDAPVEHKAKKTYRLTIAKNRDQM